LHENRLVTVVNRILSLTAIDIFRGTKKSDPSPQHPFLVQGKETGKRLALQEIVERRLREKIRSQLPPTTSGTANERIELIVTGLTEAVNREQLITLLAPYGLVLEGTAEVEGGGQEVNVTLLTTPDAAILACKGTCVRSVHTHWLCFK
jgi:hypothetical protein